ncbi:hypothetical protein CFREI_10430 [Corynebacterium freiburgense]|nr:hypothetical protein CFREI_10430 [Corynebacterium freiburgense]
MCVASAGVWSCLEAFECLLVQRITKCVDVGRKTECVDGVCGVEEADEAVVDIPSPMFFVGFGDCWWRKRFKLRDGYWVDGATVVQFSQIGIRMFSFSSATQTSVDVVNTEMLRAFRLVVALCFYVGEPRYRSCSRQYFRITLSFTMRFWNPTLDRQCARMCVLGRWSGGWNVFCNCSLPRLVQLVSFLR